jgi:bifunctional non-homologous end joining protein LigD
MLTRDVLREMGLCPVVKTSGGKGLHIVLHTKRSHGWETMRDFTKAVSQLIADHNPGRFVVTASKAKRKGRIFIDWMRNGEGATCVAPWSLRAKSGASVSMPINWADLRHIKADGFTIREPSSMPSDWLDSKPQTIPKALLRRLGLG